MTDTRGSGELSESQDFNSDVEPGESQGYQVLKKYFPKEAARSRTEFSRRKFDTYQGMIQLRELMRGGKISKSDYEAAKVELLLED